jgi:hypothetical protein
MDSYRILYRAFLMLCIALSTLVLVVSATHDGSGAGTWVMFVAVLLLGFLLWRSFHRGNTGDPGDRVHEFLRAAEYRDLIQQRLPHGETIISLAPAYTAVPATSYGILVLTNLTLRFVTFGGRKQGDLNWRSRHNTEVISETTMRLSDVTTSSRHETSDSSTAIASRILGRAFGSPLAGLTASSRIPVVTLSVLFTAGVHTQFASPFSEMNTLIRNLDSGRAGEVLASRAVTTAEALGRLSVLADEGIISSDEFERAKAGFVGHTVEHTEGLTAKLRQLHTLLGDGVLTESEFRAKKWDLLSRDQ